MDAAISKPDDARLLREIERRVLWLSAWTIHNANHVRPSSDGDVKVGGHQASSASLATIMTALYFHVLRPEDRVAVKPHASPVFHAIQYLAGNQTREKLEDFRAFGGAQSYPSRTKDADDVDFSTGSVGLGVAQTLFSSIVQDYVRAHGWSADRPEGRMVSLIGDAEMDEGNIYEALIEGWKQGLRNCWWVVDYNRQSLDAVTRDGLWEKFETMFSNFGWDVVILKHGEKQRAAFAEPGGDRLREWIERCPNPLYSALTFQGGAAWRKRLTDEIGDQGPVTALIDRRSDAELAELMGNLGGHDLPTLLDAFGSASTHDRPTLFVCYTTKGHGLSLAGHKDNHAGLMTPAQMETFRDTMKVRPGREWEPWEGAQAPADALARFVSRAPFFAKGSRRHTAPAIPIPARLEFPDGAGKAVSTQAGFGQILNEIARRDDAFGDRIVTTAPDVTVSTNLGPWVNRRGLFARESLADTFKGRAHTLDLQLVLLAPRPASRARHRGIQPLPDAVGPRPLAQHQWRAAASRRHGLRPVHLSRRRPVELCLLSGRPLHAGGDAFGRHARPGGRRAPVDRHALGRHGAGRTGGLRARLRRRAGGDHALRLRIHAAPGRRRHRRAQLAARRDRRLGLSQALHAPRRAADPRHDGRARERRRQRRLLAAKARTDARLIVAYQGAVAPQAIEAVGLMSEDRGSVGLLAITSADRLNAGWTAAQRARERGLVHAASRIERLMDEAAPGTPIVTVIDGHPATLAWIGAVRGNPVRALGVEHFGQSGTLADLYRHHGIDAQAILRAAEAIAPGRPIRHLRTAGA